MNTAKLFVTYWFNWTPYDVWRYPNGNFEVRHQRLGNIVYTGPLPGIPSYRDVGRAIGEIV